MTGCILTAFALTLAVQSNPPVKLSQHGSVTQNVAATTITVKYQAPSRADASCSGGIVP